MNLRTSVQLFHTFAAHPSSALNIHLNAKNQSIATKTYSLLNLHFSAFPSKTHPKANECLIVSAIVFRCGLRTEEPNGVNGSETRPQNSRMGSARNSMA